MFYLDRSCFRENHFSIKIFFVEKFNNMLFWFPKSIWQVRTNCVFYFSLGFYISSLDVRFLDLFFNSSVLYFLFKEIDLFFFFCLMRQLICLKVEYFFKVLTSLNVGLWIKLKTISYPKLVDLILLLWTMKCWINLIKGVPNMILLERSLSLDPLALLRPFMFFS